MAEAIKVYSKPSVLPYELGYVVDSTLKPSG